MCNMVDTVMLRKFMIDAGFYTITELSKKSGISRNTLSAVFKGKKNPSTDIMIKLISVLEIEPAVAGQVFFSMDLRNK